MIDPIDIRRLVGGLASVVGRAQEHTLVEDAEKCINIHLQIRRQ